MAHEVREITVKLTEPLCELIEFARKQGNQVVPLSQFFEEQLREAPLVQLRNRMARIDLGTDADMPDWQSLCSGSAAAPAKAEKPARGRPKSKPSAETQ